MPSCVFPDQRSVDEGAQPDFLRLSQHIATARQQHAAQLKSMRKILKSLYNFAGYLAGAAVLGIFLIMIGTTAMRQFSMGTGGSDDLVAWLAAAAALLAMAHTFQHGDLVRMTLVVQRLPAGARRWVEVLALVAGAACSTYLAYWVIVSVYQTWELGDMANGLIVVPLWIPQLSMVFGSLLFSVAMIDELVSVLTGHTPSYVEAVNRRRASGDFGEEV